MDMLPTVVHERNYFSNLIMHILNIYFENNCSILVRKKKEHVWRDVSQACFPRTKLFHTVGELWVGV